MNIVIIRWTDTAGKINTHEINEDSQDKASQKALIYMEELGSIGVMSKDIIYLTPSTYPIYQSSSEYRHDLEAEVWHKILYVVNGVPQNLTTAKPVITTTGNRRITINGISFDNQTPTSPLEFHFHGKSARYARDTHKNYMVQMTGVSAQLIDTIIGMWLIWRDMAPHLRGTFTSLLAAKL